MSTFDYLFNRIRQEEPWMTLGLKGELYEYLKCSNSELNDLFWMVKNGYSKDFIKNAVFIITGKTTEELDSKEIS
jgi:hypothetical protein